MGRPKGSKNKPKTSKARVTPKQVKDGGLDIVYVLGTGSKFDNFELKISLRSIEKYGKGYSRIFIIGEKPEWINYDKVTHIPAKDISNIPAINSTHKLLIACNSDEISENFILFNDDFFLTKKTNFSKLKNYTRPQKLRQSFPPEKRFAFYNRIIARTDKVLKDNGFDTNHFGIHLPITINSKKFIDMYNKFQKEINEHNGLSTRSLYGNYAELEPTPIKDCKINIFFSYKKIEPFIKDTFCISVGDKTLEVGDMKKWLEDNYSVQSKFEK